MSTPAAPWAKYAAPASDGPWAKYGGGAPPIATTPPPEQPGFLKSLGQSFGIDTDADPSKQSLMDRVEQSQPAIGLAKGLYHGFMRSTGEISKAVDKAKEGNGWGVLQHGISALPIVGSAIDRGVEQMPATRPGESFLGQVGDAATTPGVLGTSVGAAAQLAPMALGAVDEGAPGRSTFGAIPSKARAASMLDEVGKTVGDAPVNLTRTLPEIEKAQRLSEWGHGTITPIDRFYQRMQTINPVGYEEARGRYTPLTRLTANDSMNATPQLKAAAGSTAKALRSDIGDTATQFGVGDLYEKGMSEYARAAKLRDLLKTTGKFAAGAAGTAAVGGAGYHYLKDILGR